MAWCFSTRASVATMLSIGLTLSLHMLLFQVWLISIKLYLHLVIEVIEEAFLFTEEEYALQIQFLCFDWSFLSDNNVIQNKYDGIFLRIIKKKTINNQKCMDVSSTLWVLMLWCSAPGHQHPHYCFSIHKTALDQIHRKTLRSNNSRKWNFVLKKMT